MDIFYALHDNLILADEACTRFSKLKEKVKIITADWQKIFNYYLYAKIFFSL